MADSFTSTLNLTKPEVGFSNATWGAKTNANWDAVDAEILARRNADTALATNANSRVLRTGDTMTGNLTAPLLAVDAQGYLTVSGGTTVLNWDTNDALHFTRSNNTASVVIGGAAKLQVNATDAFAQVPFTLNVGSTLAQHATRKDYVDAAVAGANANANNRLPLSGGVLTGDLTTYRAGAPGTGAVFLGNTGARYLFWDGANYSMPGGNLYVANTNAVWHSGNLPSPAVTNAYQVFSAQQQIACASPYLDLHWPGIAVWRAQVNGSGQLCWTDQNNAVKATLDASGNFLASNYVATSDASVKSDVRPITGALAKVRLLQGKTFVRDDINDSDRRMGFIAQQLQPVVPEVVREVGNIGLLGVSYGEITALLAEAVKELDAATGADQAAKSAALVSLAEAFDALAARVAALEAPPPPPPAEEPPPEGTP